MTKFIVLLYIKSLKQNFFHECKNMRDVSKQTKNLIKNV